jgi:hypothetical protein
LEGRRKRAISKQQKKIQSEGFFTHF